ncbi:uncharacterized protein LOC109596728 [Aethina tumida]|uniref:uncharacterized protein LOC109596728 n=1 Tax=Aethina tumida TaxID=116153 RepID=UPI002149366D|nr:uncharacterized protein LOC109596728 [Aethina tumida]
MHGSAGLHSAMAIKRQRRMREQQKKRVAERRLSSRTSMDSMDSIERLPSKHVSSHAPPDALATSIGMLHLGVCFLVLGIFLIGSGLLPDDVVTWRGGGWWNELVVTGIFVTALGVFLIGLNRVMSRREEDELQDYVERQLTRSRSGHRLERDVETGGLTTKHHRRFLEKQREDKDRGITELTPVHSPHQKTAHTNIHNGDIQLEKILEEDVFERPEMEFRNLDLKETMSNTTTASLSPGTPSETRELISNGRQYSFNSRQY